MNLILLSMDYNLVPPFIMKEAIINVKITPKICIESHAESRVRGLCSAPTLTPTLTLTFMPTFHRGYRARASQWWWWVAVRPTLTVQSAHTVTDTARHHRTAFLLHTNTLCVLEQARGEGQGQDKLNVMKWNFHSCSDKLFLNSAQSLCCTAMQCTGWWSETINH